MESLSNNNTVKTAMHTWCRLSPFPPGPTHSFTVPLGQWLQPGRSGYGQTSAFRVLHWDKYGGGGGFFLLLLQDPHKVILIFPNTFCAFFLPSLVCNSMLHLNLLYAVHISYVRDVFENFLKFLLLVRWILFSFQVTTCFSSLVCWL